MNRFTASFDFPQKEQRRCLSLAMDFNREREERWLRRAGIAGEPGQITSLGLFVLHLHHLAAPRDHVVDQAVLLAPRPAT